MKFRPHRSLLSESMAEMVVVDGMSGLLKHLEDTHPKYGPAFRADDVVVKLYHDHLDPRIDWEQTYIVTSPPWGVIGFTDSDK